MVGKSNRRWPMRLGLCQPRRRSWGSSWPLASSHLGSEIANGRFLCNAAFQLSQPVMKKTKGGKKGSWLWNKRKCSTGENLNRIQACNFPGWFCAGIKLTALSRHTGLKSFMNIIPWGQDFYEPKILGLKIEIQELDEPKYHATH